MIYNPFKPHIVVNGEERYAIRRFSIIFFWQYLDESNLFLWWHSAFNVEKYAFVNDLKTIKANLDRYNKRRIIKVIK